MVVVVAAGGSLTPCFTPQRREVLSHISTQPDCSCQPSTTTNLTRCISRLVHTHTLFGHSYSPPSLSHTLMLMHLFSPLAAPSRQVMLLIDESNT